MVSPLPSLTYNNTVLTQISEMALMRMGIIREALRMAEQNVTLNESIQRDALNDEYRILNEIVDLAENGPDEK